MASGTARQSIPNCNIGLGQQVTEYDIKVRFMSLPKMGFAVLGQGRYREEDAPSTAAIS